MHPAGSVASLGEPFAPSLSRRPSSWVVFFIVLMALLHVRAFYQAHDEGDERVYLVVAESMGWDLSNYSTRDSPDVSRYPYSIYRQSLFHQPPLYPIVLKVGGLFGQPVYAGLVFQVLAMALLLVFARRFALLLEFGATLEIAFYAALTFCPLLLFSTTRLHHDGLMAIFAFCAFTMLIEALDGASARKAVVSGLFFVAALNVRYNALALLPLIFAFQLFHLYRRAGDTNREFASVARNRAEWKCFVIVLGLVIALGLPHYVRIWATYGSLFPSTFIIPDPGIEAWSQFTRRISQRSRIHVAIYLVLIFPMLLTWLTRRHARLVVARFQERSWAVMYGVVAVSLFAVHIVMLHRQVRYFAALTPFVFVWFMTQLQASEGRQRDRLWKLAVFTFFLMVIGGVSSAIFRPAVAQAVPAIVNLLPFLNRYYL